MKELIGKRIKSISVSDDQHILSFETDKGTVCFDVDGDCCSESWFADLTGFAALLDGTVQAVEEVSMDGYNVEDGRSRQDCDEAYGYKITTDKGRADIVFRNSSNGYYGGYLNYCEDGLPPEANMKPITADWSA